MNLSCDLITDEKTLAGKAITVFSNNILNIILSVFASVIENEVEKKLLILKETITPITAATAAIAE